MLEVKVAPRRGKELEMHLSRKGAPTKVVVEEWSSCGVEEAEVFTKEEAREEGQISLESREKRHPSLATIVERKGISPLNAQKGHQIRHKWFSL